jgi:hypothetical protein
MRNKIGRTFERIHRPVDLADTPDRHGAFAFSLSLPLSLSLLIGLRDRVVETTKRSPRSARSVRFNEPPVRYVENNDSRRASIRGSLAGVRRPSVLENGGHGRIGVGPPD